MNFFKDIKDLYELIVFFSNLPFLVFIIKSQNITHLKIYAVLFCIINFVLVFFVYRLNKNKKKITKENELLKIKTDEKISEHDKNIFKGSDEIMPEKHFQTLINSTLFNGSCRSWQSEMIDKYLIYFSNTGAVFMNKNIDNKFKNFKTKLSEIDYFIGLNFFTTENTENLKLHPDIKYSTIDEWHVILQELRTLIDEIEPLYTNFRATVKEELFI